MASRAQDTNRPDAEIPSLLSSFRRFVTFAEAEILVRECIYAISDAIRRCVASRAFSYLICMRCDASSPRCSIRTTSTLVLLVVYH